MGSSCTSLRPNETRHQRARTRSRAHTATLDDDGGFPAPIEIHEKYSFVDGVLEEGATGSVVKGFEKNNKNNQVAIKIMPKSSNHGYETAQSLFENEVNILTRIHHINIVELLDIAEDEANYYVILSLGKGGDLVEYIFDDNVHINERDAAAWTRTMLETLQYLHLKNIVHCDLKPENIVFKSHRGCDDILLIDFGLAKIVNDDSIYNDLCANKYYTAPEIAAHYLNLEDSSELNGKIWKSTDVWSVGIICYIMVLRTLPFFAQTDKATFECIVNDELKLPKMYSDTYCVSQDFRDFIQKILHKNPYKRMGIDQALRHSWIRGNTGSVTCTSSRSDESITFVRYCFDRDRLDINNDDNKSWSVLSKDLIYGYIRNVLYASSVQHKRKLTVMDGNLYFNCALKSQNKVIDDVPLLVINTIYRSIYNVLDTDNDIVLDGRSHTIIY